MQDFEKVVQAWRGRRYVEARFVALGFHAHKIYQAFVEDFCIKNEVRCDVGAYWDACAEEWICSYGQVNSDLRLFEGPPAYRSQFLDNLFSESERKEFSSNTQTIHPCLLAYKESDRSSGHALSREVRELTGKRKDLEIIEQNGPEFCWNGGIKELKDFIKTVAEKFGFKKGNIKKWEFQADGLESNGYYKESPSGLIFYICLENVKGGVRFRQLPLRFAIIHPNNPSKRIWLNMLEFIVPGTHYYARYETNEQAVLGVKALIALFSIVYQSLEQDH